MTMFSESLRVFLRPVVPFLDDPEVAEVLINGPREIWVEKRGKLVRTDVTFTEEGLLAAARNMAQSVGRPLSDERPRLDARMPDGSRIHVVLAPVARRGTTISIRKFFAERLTVEKLLELGSLSKRMSRLLEGAVALKKNMVVSGGTSSGKTSLLNVLSQFIPKDERILTLEDSAELQLAQPHVVGFESRPADKLGKGQVDIGDLLNSALRLRPDRIVVGEVRGGECFHLLQAMNTGHGGTLTSAHANTPVDTLRRLESLCLLSGVELPLRAIRAQVASAVHLVVCCERFGDGSRKLTRIAEVLPLDEHGDYRAQDLVEFEQSGRDAGDRVTGRFVWTGAKPGFFAKLAGTGFGDVEAAWFEKGNAEEAVLPQIAEDEKSHDTDPNATAPVHEKPRKPAPPVMHPVARPKPVAAAPIPLPPPMPKSTPAVAVPAEPVASIQLAPDLEREVQARLPNESTLITRNPLHRRADDEDTNPDARRRQ
jgi:pilus assembly protein CpaF